MGLGVGLGCKPFFGHVYSQQVHLSCLLTLPPTRTKGFPAAECCDKAINQGSCTYFFCTSQPSACSWMLYIEIWAGDVTI